MEGRWDLRINPLGHGMPGQGQDTTFRTAFTRSRQGTFSYGISQGLLQDAIARTRPYELLLDPGHQAKYNISLNSTEIY